MNHPLHLLLAIVSLTWALAGMRVPGQAAAVSLPGPGGAAVAAASSPADPGSLIPVAPAGSQSEAITSPSALNLELVSVAGGTSLAVAAQGNYAYLGEGYRLAIIDVSDAASRTLVGKSDPLPDIIQGITIVGTVAYVADKSGGLYILDVSDPQQPAVLGSLDTPGEANEVAVAGDYAFVADGAAGLRVVDISAPDSPQPAGALAMPGQARGVALAGNYAYLADGDTMRIVDVSNPLLPSARGFYPPTPPGWTIWYAGIAVAGNYAYTSDGYDLQVLDVANPAAPAQAGNTGLLAGPYAVALAGHSAYLASSSGVLVVDISDPAHPTGGGSISCSPACKPATDVAVGTNYVYYATGAGLSAGGLTNPVNPSEEVYSSPGKVFDVRVSGRYAYAAMGEGGMGVFDTADLDELTLVGRVSTPGSAGVLAVAGDTAILGDTSKGQLRFIDISNPAAPHDITSFAAPGGIGDVEVQGSYAYVANGLAGLRIVDISDPAHPHQEGIVSWLDNLAGGVAVAGDYAYVADGEQGLRVIDVSNPAAPTAVGHYDPFGAYSGPAVGVTVAGDLAYIAYSYRGLYAASIADPAHPTSVGKLETSPASVYDVALLGGYACLGTDRSVMLVDVRDPVHPAAVDAYPTKDAAARLALRGDVVFAANRAAGITVLRVVGFPKVYLPIVLK